MHPALAILFIIIGLALLVVGSDALVRGAAKLASRLGVSTFAIGVTVVAFGTSTPELFASVRATLDGIGEMGVGNVVGSNIANVLLILGLTTLVRPVTVDKAVLRLDLPVMLLISVLASLVLVAGDGVIGRSEGGLLTGALIIYIVFSYWSGKRDPHSLAHELEQEAEEEYHLDEQTGKAWIDVVFILIGLVGLGAGAELLVSGARTIAEDVLGVSPAVVGLTIVAFGTSLPELAASLRAVLAKEPGMAVGNVIGSNVFNLLSVLGISALVRPLPVRDGAGWDVAVMIGAAVLCYPVLGGRAIKRGQGIAMLMLYLAYMALVFVM